MPDIWVLGADGSKRRVPLQKERITIGRSRESDIFLPDQWLSRQHAEVRTTADGAHVLVDLGSKNGTLLNGETLRSEKRLQDGDLITLGEHRLTYSGRGEPAEEDAAAPEGTQIFSARELSDAATKPATDADALARQNRILKVLTQSAEQLLAHWSMPEIFEKVLALLFEAVPAERAAILLLEGTPPVAQIKASRSRKGTPITHVPRSIVRRVMQDRVAMILPNLMEDSAFAGQDSILASGIRSAICAPLWFMSTKASEDQVIGIVYLDTLQRAHSFSQDDLEVVTAFANLAASKIQTARLLEESLEKRRLEEDLRLAAEIQRGLLPSKAPQVPGYGLVGSNRPCRTIGGDYYDFALDGGQLRLALGDVVGKGSGAALLMAVLRAVVRAHWGAEDLAEAAARINANMCENVPEGKYVTFFFGRLDAASGRLTYVNAGHNPPLLVRREGGIDELKEGGMVLGLLDGSPYSSGTAELRPGDALLVFSDGVTETWNPEDEEYGETRLTEVARRCLDHDAARLEQEVLADLETFASGMKAADDRTLIVLKRQPS